LEEIHNESSCQLLANQKVNLFAERLVAVKREGCISQSPHSSGLNACAANTLYNKQASLRINTGSTQYQPPVAGNETGVSTEQTIGRQKLIQTIFQLLANEH
jgi:hypothetical protein